MSECSDKESMEIDISRNLGIFAISLELIHKYPELVQKAMSEVIVVRAELMYASMEVEYVALSKHFREVEPEMAPPRYRCIVDDNQIRFEEYKL